MSDSCPTVRILNDSAPGGFVVINEIDFDPAAHTICQHAGEPGLDDMTVPQLKALAETRAVDLGDATKKADIIAALELAAEAEAEVENEAV